MVNSIKAKNSKEVLTQLKRAEVQKKYLIKNIYKEYELYFQIVRESILSSAEKGIFDIYSDFSISEKVLDSRELNIFLNKNVSLLVHSKLPLITIEQLKLGDVTVPKKELLNLNSLKELGEFKEYQTVNSNYENQSIPKESLEFYLTNTSNTYEYYESLSEDELPSINLDESFNINSLSKEISLKKIDDEKYIVNPLLELIEETNDIKLNNYEKITGQVGDVFISIDNLNSFDVIDKSFSNFLLDLSYKINSELFKINLIDKFVSEDSFKCLSNNYLIKHPYPFVIRYDLNPNKLSKNNTKSTDIYLLNITNIELEVFNFELSICRNNINELKNRFRLLNKKQRYWENKELVSNNSN